MTRSTKFVGIYKQKNTEFCDQVIDLFKVREKKLGELLVNRVDTVDITKKHSLDVVVDPNDPALFDYFAMLQKCVNKYIKKYYYCDQHAPWRVIEGVNIQYYPPGGGYKVWHAERGTCEFPKSARHLVFMTYLNTVVEGGGTEWLYQKLNVNAEKGKTVIWPADWTFTHRGVVAPGEEKYIITGWFNFIQ